MNRYCLSVGTALLVCTNTLMAQPFQFELRGAFSQLDSSRDGFPGNVEADSLLFHGRYYLQLVDHSEGPLSERAFLDKAASVGVTFNQVKPEFGDDVDSIGVDARFVTITNTVVELAYSTTDSSQDSDTKLYRVAAGKYIDHQTTVLGAFDRTDSDDATLDVISVELRKVEATGAANAYMAYSGGFGFLMASDDFGNDENGFEFDARLTYYPSEQLGFGGGLAYRDIDDADVTSFGVNVEYFLTDAFSVAAVFERNSNSADIDTDILGVSVAARF